MALEPLNDEAKSLNLGLRPSKLGPLTISLRGQLTNQTTQGIDVIRQRGEIEGHASESMAAARRCPRQSSI